MELDIWHVAIPVKNLDKSVTFYHKILGLKLIGYDEYPSKKQAFVATKEGGFTIELFEPKGTAASKPFHQPDHLAFECKDINQFRENLLRNGFTSVPEIETFDNGVKYIGLEDPNGVNIEFFEGRSIYEKSISINV